MAWGKWMTSNSIVAIHDGVRPLASTSLINSLISKAKDGIGIIPIVPVKDSIRKVDGRKFYAIDRKNLYKVQTPQCFLSIDIKKLMLKNSPNILQMTLPFLKGTIGGKNTTAILGENKNIKITTIGGFHRNLEFIQ